SREAKGGARKKKKKKKTLRFAYFPIIFPQLSSFPATSPKMATDLLICCNTGAISCVPDTISTIYWGTVLTAKAPNRKVSTSQLGDAAVFGRSVGRWNRLSKYFLLFSELPFFMGRLNPRCSIVEIPSSLAKGECCA